MFVALRDITTEKVHYVNVRHIVRMVQAYHIVRVVLSNKEELQIDRETESGAREHLHYLIKRINKTK